MGENMEDNAGDVDMSNAEMVFDNLTILKEFSNIANLVRNEDFLEIVPKAKIRRVIWLPLFNLLKQNILEEMVQEISAMWLYENMTQKLETLEKQREKFAESDKIAWRPQLGDVKAQLKAHGAANLKKQKVLLESMAKDYEGRVNKLKKVLTAKRGYLKALQMDIQKYQKKNENYITQINEKLENHKGLTNMLVLTKTDDIDAEWTPESFDTNE